MKLKCKGIKSFLPLLSFLIFLQLLIGQLIFAGDAPLGMVPARSGQEATTISEACAVGGGSPGQQVMWHGLLYVECNCPNGGASACVSRGYEQMINLGGSSGSGTPGSRNFESLEREGLAPPAMCEQFKLKLGCTLQEVAKKEEELKNPQPKDPAAPKEEAPKQAEVPPKGGNSIKDTEAYQKCMLKNGATSRVCEEVAKQGRPGICNEQGFSDAECDEYKRSVGVNPGSGGSVTTDEEALEALVKQCEAEEKVAYNCCNNPVKCMDSDSGVSNGDMQIIAGLLTAGAGMAVGASGDIAAMCGTQQMMGYGSAALNGAMGTMCLNKKNTCDNTCSAARTQLAAQKQACGTDSDCKVTVGKYLARVEGKVSRCNGLNANLMAMGNQATQGILSAQLAALCKKQAEATSTGFDQFDPKTVFNGDCSDPANASNPFCQNNCNRPGNENNPLCRSNSGIANLGGGSSSTDLSSFGERNRAAIDMGSTEKQGPGLVSVPQSAGRKTSGVNGNGGGFVAGGGGTTGSFGNTGGGGGGGGGGYDTNILQGLGGGNGYTVSPGGGFSNGGGFSGYGSGGGGKAEGAAFDLKRYLPGGGNTNPGINRRIAGASGITMGEIGGKYEDIWLRISRRVYHLCVAKKLKDCDNDLVKIKKRLGY